MAVLTSFFFAWVDADQTAFTPHQEVVDEDIFAFELKHEEGQIPTLDITIKNPRVGLLSPHRHQWAWLARQRPDGHVVPIFFGVLVGIPTDLFAELVTLQFIARSTTYIAQKQAVAETMKVRPYWDPVFLDEKHRDDPDSILEGWSSLWHVDRTSLLITASDILTGEDGTVDFDGDDAYYKNVSMKLEQAPLANIQLQATVTWTQRSTGYVDGPSVNVQTYTGDTFLGDWPKGGTRLGGGWTVESSFMNDVYKTSLTPMEGNSYSWSTSDPNLLDCDVNSTSSSNSGPALLGAGISRQMTFIGHEGVCDPYSDPPDNRGSDANWTGMIIPLWTLNGTWRLRYEAKREYTELLTFNVFSHTQAILTAPTVQQNTELITISGANVGEPLEEVDAWTDFAGKPVGLAQIIFPNNPTTPGGLSYQICVAPGTAGLVEPVFSDIPGTITLDGGQGAYFTVEPGTGGTRFTLQPATTMPFADLEGPIYFNYTATPSDLSDLTPYWVHVINATTISLATGYANAVGGTFIATTDTSGADFFLYGAPGVSWASMGTSPVNNQRGWTDSTYVALGEIIFAVPKHFSETAGQWEDDDFGAFLLCTQAGETNSTITKFRYIPPITNSDEPTPAPIDITFIPGPGWTWSGDQQGGGQGDLGFGGGLGSSQSDGTVQWTALNYSPSWSYYTPGYEPPGIRAPGLLGVPIGGTPVNITANNYFPSDRGRWSVEYLLCKARARLRLRARAVRVSWDCPFDPATGLSCRMNATLHDPRLPGGIATGKVISYSLKADGRSGELVGHCEIGCAVGYGETIAAVAGTPEYTAAAGYMKPGYQRYDGAVVPIANSTLGYTPIQYAVFDDGLTFPLLKLPTAGDPKGTISFSAPAQAPILEAAMAVAAQLAQAVAQSSQTFTTELHDSGVVTTTSNSHSGGWLEEQAAFINTSANVPYVMEANPVSWQIDIKPVTNGPFDGAYSLTVSVLEIPQGINLEAPSVI